MTRHLLALSLFVPAVAAAQATLTLDFNGNDEALFSAKECANELTVTWRAVAPSLPQSDLTFWSTEGECGDTAGANDVKYASIDQATWQTQATSTFNLKVAELPFFKGGGADGGIVCETTGVERTAEICAAFTYLNAALANTVQRVTNPPTITYDAVPPAPPSIDEVVALNEALSIKFSAGAADTAVIHIEVRSQGEADFVRRASAGADTSSLRLSGLTNDTTYELRAIGEDEAGNFSEPSDIVSGTPVHTDGFFAAYRRAGGTAQGCTAAGGGTLAALSSLAALGFGFRRRRT